MGECNTINNPETGVEEFIPHDRLEKLRKTVDAGVERTLSWRLAQLDGLLRFIDDHEDSMLTPSKQTWADAAPKPDWRTFPWFDLKFG